LLILSRASFSQKHEFGLNLFSLEMNHEPINQNRLNSKFIIGGYYTRKFDWLNWTTSIEYVESEVQDNCRSCFKSQTMSGVLEEFNVFSGLGVQWQYKSFGGEVRLSAFASASNYSVLIPGEWFFNQWSPPLAAHDKYYSVGGQVLYSNYYSFDFGLVLRLDLGLRLGQVWKEGNHLSSTKNYTEYFNGVLTFPMLRVGYQF